MSSHCDTVMIKDLFGLISLVILRPEQAWRLVKSRYTKPSDALSEKIFYPALGLLCLVAFVGSLLNAPGIDFMAAIKSSVLYLMTGLSAFYLNLIAMPVIASKVPGFRASRHRWEAFILHAYAPIYLLTILFLIFPQLILLRILMLYTVYIVWIGCLQFWALPESRLFSATAIFSILIFLFSSGVMRILQMLPVFSN